MQERNYIVRYIGNFITLKFASSRFGCRADFVKIMKHKSSLVHLMNYTS